MLLDIVGSWFLWLDCHEYSHRQNKGIYSNVALIRTCNILALFIKFAHARGLVIVVVL